MADNVLGLLIGSDGQLATQYFTGLADFQAAVGGYVQSIHLNDGVVLLVNEEGLLTFTYDDANDLAQRVAVAGGAVHLAARPLLGPAVVVGTAGANFSDVDLTVVADWLNLDAHDFAGVDAGG